MPKPSPPATLPPALVDAIATQEADTLHAVREYVDDLLEHRTATPEPEDLPEAADIVETAAGPSGTIVEERVKCGTDCTCNDGTGHGPYRYRYYRKNGVLTSDYLGKA